MILKNYNLAIVGLGYVGLPLAVSFSYKRNTIGFDINEDRIKELRDNLDRTNEVSKKSLENSNLFLTSSESDLKDCNFFIVTVPTPIDKDKKLITTIKKADLAKDTADQRPEVFSKDNALDAKIVELDFKTRKIKLSVKAAQIDEEKSLIAKFGEGATKSGATLKGIFEKAIGKKNKKEK